jgi:hypothetical protein
MAINQGTRRRGALAVLAGAALFSISSLPSVTAEASRARESGVTLMNARGFSLNTYPRSGTLRRVRVRFERGFAVKLRSADRRRTFGYYTVDSARGQLFGYFMIPPGTLPRTIPLIGIRDAKIAQPGESLRATLTTGLRPTLVIMGFPEGATKLEFGTSGTGKTASFITSPCVDRRRAVRGSMLITTRGGKLLPGNVAPGLLCGVGRPVDPSR